MDLSIHMQVCTYNCIDFASMHANKHYIVTSCYFLDCHIPIFALVRTSLVSALVNSCMPSLEEKQKDTKELQQQVPLEQWRVGDRSAWADPHCGSSHPVPPWVTTQTCCHKSRQGGKKWCFTSCGHISDPFLFPAAGGVANAHAPCGFFGSRALAGTFLPRSERADQGGIAKWWNGLSPSAVQKNIHHYESHNDIMLYTYPYNHIYISLYPPSSVPSWSSPAYIRIDRGWGDSTIWAQQNRWTQEGWRQWLSGWKMMMSWSLGPAGRMMMCSGLHTWIWKYGGFQGSVWQEGGCLMDSLPAKSLLNDARKRTGNTKYFPSTTFKHILVGGLEHEFYLPFHIWVI